MLSENDVKVLKAISDGDSDPQSIAEKLGMKVEAVRASADALSEQGLVQVTKSVVETFPLTEEGTKYAKEGLPERSLLESLGSGKPMSELKDPAQRSAWGGCARRAGLQSRRGCSSRLGSAPKGKDEEILETLLAGPKSSKDLDEKGLADLKSRGLVESSKTKEWRYEITEEGNKSSV